MKILHMFNWNLKDIINNLEEIKESQWDYILISPVQPSKEPNGDWYMNYQITDLSIGNHHGSKEDLIKLCNKAHKLGIGIFVDVIVTHFANAGGGELELIPHELVNKKFTNNTYIWRDKKYINYKDRNSVINHCNGLATVRLDNYDYQDIVIEFLNELIDCGIDGIRIDSCKLISLPEENGNHFFTRVLEGLKKDILVFGEIIFESKELIQKYQKYIYVLNEFNKYSYDIDRDRLITFIESHDSFLDSTIRYTSNWSQDKVDSEYRIIKNDFNILYYTRPFSDSWKYVNK